MELSGNNSISRLAKDETPPVIISEEQRVAYIRQIRDLIAETGELTKLVDNHRIDLVEKQSFEHEFVDCQRTQSWTIPVAISDQNCLLTYREISWAELEEADESTVDLSDPALFSESEPEVWALEISHDGGEEPFYSISTTIDGNCFDIDDIDIMCDQSGEYFDQAINDLTDLNVGLKEDYRDQLEA